MAEDHQRHGIVPDWLRARHSGGCVRERGAALPPDDLRRDDGSSSLSPQGREEWESEWATVAFVPDGDQGSGDEAGGVRGRYVYVTSSPLHKRKSMLVLRYPTSATYVVYISVVVTILLLLQVFWRG
jgi:hypothetical protein